MAEGGAILLDEVGEHPAEAHIAVLRVLQEQFERDGGTGSSERSLELVQ
jgi:transcriptional regulator with GAF, ATPase, and Fis domain